MDKTRKQVMSVAIAVALLSVATIAVINMPVAAKNTEINILAQVNENGSAIVFTNAYAGNPDSYRTIDGSGNLTFTVDQVNNWRNKIIGTPGPTTIQHTMMATMVKQMSEASVQGGGNAISFVPFVEGQGLSDGNIHYQASIANISDWTSFKDQHSTDFLGCIIWEMVVSQINLGTDIGSTHYYPSGKTVIDSKYMDPGHACCVIGANNTFLNENYNATVRFLNAYVKGVKEVAQFVLQETIDENFIKFATEFTGQSKDVVTNALKNVKYTYGDTGDVLGSLRNNIIKFVNGNGWGDIVKSQGYRDVEEFADQLVDDRFINEALEYEGSGESWKTIKITAINGDIHQIALHWANYSNKNISKENYFAKNNINIEVSYGKNGAAVATSLQNGEADLGFMGVPPLTSTVIRSELNPALHFELSGRIVDEEGKPVANKTIEIIPSVGNKYVATTDSDGHFTVTVVKGTYAKSDTCAIRVVFSESDVRDTNVKVIDSIVSNYEFESDVVMKG